MEIYNKKVKTIKFEDYKGKLLIGSLVLDANMSFDNFKLEIDGHDLPKFAHPAEEMRLKFNTEFILEQALEEHYDDAYDSLVDKEGLENFLTEWANKQGIVSHYEDMSTIIIFPEVELK